MPNEGEGMNCMCGCHIIDDPANMGQRCDLCVCIAGYHKMMREANPEGRRETYD